LKPTAAKDVQKFEVTTPATKFSLIVSQQLDAPVETSISEIHGWNSMITDRRDMI